MLSDEKNQPVELSETQNASATVAVAELAKQIEVVRGLIFEAMNHQVPEQEEGGEEGPGESVYYSGASSLVVHGPEYCYVYDNVQGVCRPCTPEEEAGLETMQSQ